MRATVTWMSWFGLGSGSVFGSVEIKKCLKACLSDVSTRLACLLQGNIVETMELWRCWPTHRTRNPGPFGSGFSSFGESS